MCAASLCAEPLRRLQIDPDEYDTVLCSLSSFISRHYPGPLFSSASSRTLRGIAWEWLRRGAGRKFWGDSHKHLIIYGKESGGGGDVDEDGDDSDDQAPPARFLGWPPDRIEIREAVREILVLLKQNPGVLEEYMAASSGSNGHDSDEDEDDDDDDEEAPHQGQPATTLVIRTKPGRQKRPLGLPYRPAKRVKRS